MDTMKLAEALMIMSMLEESEMTKPDDIPQDAWDLAARFMERAYPFGAKEFAARAIMAGKAGEREAIARILDEAHQDASEHGEPIWANKIAVAIRKRGEA